MVRTLNQVAPYDWASFLHERLTSTSPEAPLGGIENGGWKLTFTAEPQKTTGRRQIPPDLYSVGLELAEDGTVRDAVVGGPAFKAGITPGMKIVAVDDRVYTHDRFEEAIRSGTSDSKPIAVLVLNDDYYSTRQIDYHGGLRVPHLVRDPSKPDYLDQLIEPKATS